MTSPSQATSWQHETGTLTLDATPTRIVTLNWAATEAVLLLGITPVGVADKDAYSYWVREPELPDDVPNVGTRTAPSLEAIAELKPDLIVTSTEMAPAADLLEKIAPTYVISVYKDGSQPFETARKMLVTLGEILDRTARANDVLQGIDQTLAQQRHRLEEHGLNDRPVALVNFMDDRHVRVYAPNGLFQTALEALGLENAWPHPGSFWGFSTIGLEAIAPYTSSRLIVLEPIWPGLKEQLADSPFWTYLPPVQRGQVYQIEAAWPYGGVFPVKRLAVELTDALIAGGSDNVH
ncbi:ABC transporter substrate-binding protein [Marinobacter salinexigens]|uniref:ABC transporter substrate-binding protein n=1 Tax=Marinobacter salinexigens TaxID=2919747 RepID=UPI001FE52DC8|nr:ABC transporter substrate-binding protein [Marinobacter salinexigens]